MSAVVDYLEQFVEDTAGIKSSHQFYLQPHHFVLDSGSAFILAPHPQRYDQYRGALGECFRNAYMLADAFPNQLRYAEGFASFLHAGKPTAHFGLHAWCVTADNRAIDPTWENGCEYFGVVLDFGYVRSTVCKRGEWGVIDNWQEGFPLLRGEDKNTYMKMMPVGQS